MLQVMSWFSEILSTLRACQVASGVVIPWAHHRPPLREWRLTSVCGCHPPALSWLTLRKALLPAFGQRL